MHVFWFRLKRAHHASLRVGRDVLKAWAPLTPARFDLLFILHQSRQAAVDQKDLTQMLGLHHSTVSKMLKRLEELGMVRRSPVEEDFRKRTVSLTPDARRFMDRAVYEIRGDGYIELAIACAILPLRYFDEARVRAKIRRMCGTLRRYALTFYDTAIPLYARSMSPESPTSRSLLAAYF